MAHQRDDGSWHFNHLTDACMHYCTNPGSEASTTASTALALLPFLAAGYTHQKGEYQEVVQRGLEYLRTRGVAISYGFDMRDGSMYGHALATIALCEAYAMTHDAALRSRPKGASASSSTPRTSRAAAGDTTPASPATRPSPAGCWRP